MSDHNKKTIDERFLDVLNGSEDLDVTGQFLDKELLHVLEDAELLREVIIKLNQQDQVAADTIDDSDIERSKNKLIERLKKENLL